MRPKDYIVILKTRIFLRWKYRKDFWILNKVHELGRKLFLSKKVIWDERSNFRRVLVFLLAKNIQSLQAVEALCRRGFGQDALVLLRVMFECVVDLKYMHAHKERVKDYLDFDYYHKLRGARALRQSSNPKVNKESLERRIAELQRTWSEVEWRFTTMPKTGRKKICSRWNCKSLQKQSEEVGLSTSYDLLYVYASQFTHSTASIANAYVLGRDKLGIAVEMGSSEEFVPETLSTAAALFLEMVRLANEEYKADFEVEIEKVSSNLR